MHILIATDKFKGSLDSMGVCMAIKSGLQAALPGVQTTLLPLADGGDGLTDVLAHYGSYQRIMVPVADPLGRKVNANYLYDAGAQRAIVEMAQASGLHRLHPSEYNAARTTTYGTGQLITAAIEQGACHIIIGIGGSATNDGGMGMAAALGYRFLDVKGAELEPMGANLGKLHRIDNSLVKELSHIQFEVACDVTNTLTGPNGATYTYGPQKGADAATLDMLESGMLHYASLVQQSTGMDILQLAGGGAAGGLGAACYAFLNASIRSGASLVLAESRFAEKLAAADLVITGEGRLDEQSWQGKLVGTVAQACMQSHKPLVAICGSIDVLPEQYRQQGIAAAFSILNAPMQLEQAMEQAPVLILQTAFAVGAMLQVTQAPSSAKD
ncbi:glycerate kinase [Cnuella takakiae]|uniref:Glycerate kinase n=1 Tax=Cnuella takakiae TaxID=1302690 RepID=A0A1M5DZE8_9BACT|nr:glycerate kinase [Cnuella takakiae]OLY93825.1 hypothetical protein BUE76_19515 [Cnuella takakiae]SHF72320.1 glycerate kinase [Cnuella takakiae]